MFFSYYDNHCCVHFPTRSVGLAKIYFKEIYSLLTFLKKDPAGNVGYDLGEQTVIYVRLTLAQTVEG